MAEWDGRPQNPERRGWHWLGFKGQHEKDREPWAWLWSDEDGAPGEFQWMTDDDGDPERMARQFTYIAPCHTPAEVDAEVQAERAGCREAVWLALRTPSRSALMDAMTAIDARGPTPALRDGSMVAVKVQDIRDLQEIVTDTPASPEAALDQAFEWCDTQLLAATKDAPQ